MVYYLLVYLKNYINNILRKKYASPVDTLYWLKAFYMHTTTIDSSLFLVFIIIKNHIIQ